MIVPKPKISDSGALELAWLYAPECLFTIHFYLFVFSFLSNPPLPKNQFINRPKIEAERVAPSLSLTIVSFNYTVVPFIYLCSWLSLSRVPLFSDLPLSPITITTATTTTFLIGDDGMMASMRDDGGEEKVVDALNQLKDMKVYNMKGKKNR